MHLLSVLRHFCVLAYPISSNEMPLEGYNDLSTILSSSKQTISKD